MNILSSLILCSFQQEALAGTPYNSPIPVMDNLTEWSLSDKMGSVESVDIGESIIDIPLYSDEAGLPRLLSYVSVEADGKEELSIIAPNSSSIIVSAAFGHALPPRTFTNIRLYEVACSSVLTCTLYIQGTICM